MSPRRSKPSPKRRVSVGRRSSPRSVARRRCSRRPMTSRWSAMTSRSPSRCAPPRSRSARNRNPRRFLIGYTGLVVDINVRLAPIYEAVRGAASADPEVRDVFEAIGAERRIGAGRVVGDLVGKGGRLRDGLDEEAAADILLHSDRRGSVPSSRPSPWLGRRALPNVAGRGDPAGAPGLTR